MSDIRFVRVTVRPGHARTAVITGAIGDEKMAVMYSPSFDSSMAEHHFVKLRRKGNFVYLSEEVNMILLDLPGTYFFEPVSEFSGDVQVHVSDKDFPFTLTGSF